MSFDAEMLTCGDIKCLCRKHYSYYVSLKFTLIGLEPIDKKREVRADKVPIQGEDLLNIVSSEDFDREWPLNNIADFHAY